MNLFCKSVLMALCFSGWQTANAQVKLGLKGGVNITTYKLENTSSKAYLYRGFYVGPGVKVSLLGTGLGLEGSLLYEQRESELKPFERSSTDVLRQKQMSIPIHLRYGIGLGSVASVFIYAGPQFAYSLSNQQKTLVDNLATWKFNKTNLSINAGLGAMFFTHLQLSVGYNRTLGKTGELTWNSAVRETFSGKSGTWQIGLGYWF